MFDSILNNPNLLFVSTLAAIGLIFLIVTIVGIVGWTKRVKLDSQELPDFELIEEEESLPELEDSSVFSATPGSSFDIKLTGSFEDADYINIDRKKDTTNPNEPHQSRRGLRKREKEEK